LEQAASVFTGETIQSLTTLIESDTGIEITATPVVASSLPSDLTEIFSATSEFTETWDTNSCVPGDMEVIDVAPGTDLIPVTLVANKIYKLAAWDHILSSYRKLANCSAIIWEWDVNIYSNIYSSRWLIRTNNVSNAIIHWVNIDGTNDGIGGTHAANSYGLSIQYTFNSTMKNIKSYNNSTSIMIRASSATNLLEDIEVYDSYNWIALALSSSSNIINNLISYRNDYNIYMNGAFNNVFSNIETYDSTRNGGLYMAASDNNKITNLKSYNNSWKGVRMDGSKNNLFNNLQIYNNYWGIYIANWRLYPYPLWPNNVFNNLQIYNNMYSGISLNTTGNVINNASIYNHEEGLEIGGTDTVLNNVNIYSHLGYASSASWVPIPRGFGISVATTPNKYYGTLTLFDNYSDIITGVEAGVWHTIFTDWVLNKPSTTMGCTYHAQSWDGDWGADCDTRTTVSLTVPVSSYNYGANIPMQSQPVRYNGAVLEPYGSDYNTSKKIWAW